MISMHIVVRKLRPVVPDWLSSWYYRRKIKRGVYVLRAFDGWMTAAGYKRHERRQFWREFNSNREAREKFCERMGGTATSEARKGAQ